MSAKEETRNNEGFGCCQAFMENCFSAGSAEGKAEKFDFKSCEQMMKQFCAGKDGKFDFETFRLKMEQRFKRTMGKICKIEKRGQGHETGRNQK